MADLNTINDCVKAMRLLCDRIDAIQGGAVAPVPEKPNKPFFHIPDAIKQKAEKQFGPSNLGFVVIANNLLGPWDPIEGGSDVDAKALRLEYDWPAFSLSESVVSGFRELFARECPEIRIDKSLVKNWFAYGLFLRGHDKVAPLVTITDTAFLQPPDALRGEGGHSGAAIRLMAIRRLIMENVILHTAGGERDYVHEAFRFHAGTSSGYRADVSDCIFAGGWTGARYDPLWNRDGATAVDGEIIETRNVYVSRPGSTSHQRAGFPGHDRKQCAFVILDESDLAGTPAAREIENGDQFRHCVEFVPENGDAPYETEGFERQKQGVQGFHNCIVIDLRPESRGALLTNDRWPGRVEESGTRIFRSHERDEADHALRDLTGRTLEQVISVVTHGARLAHGAWTQ